MGGFFDGGFLSKLTINLSFSTIFDIMRRAQAQSMKKGCVFVLISFLRAIILYLVLIACIRLMGKRQIGEMEPAEFVVTMLLANIAAVPMQNNAIPLTTGLVPILTVLGVELVLSAATLYSIRLRKAFCGKPVILMADGKILSENLRKTRVNLDELTEHLREKDIFDLTTVKYAILETNGQISTILYAKARPATAKAAGISAPEVELPYTVVSNGRILQENLELCSLDRTWLDKQLSQRNCPLEQVLLMTVDRTGTVYFAREEARS